VESSEVLKVTLIAIGFLGVRESFLARISKSGPVRISHVTVALMKSKEPSLEGCVLEVALEPA